MPRPARSVYVCQNCGASAARWAGKCAACNEWNSLVEEASAAGPPGSGLAAARKGRVLELESLVAANARAMRRFSSGSAELDRVTGGGIVPGSALLYDCMDHHAGFENNASCVLEAEDRLIADADLLVVTSGWLDARLAEANPRRALIRNATEYRHFSERPARGLTKASGIASRQRTSALAGRPARQISSARPSGLPSDRSCAVERDLMDGVSCVVSLASMRTAYFSNSTILYSADPGGPT